MVVNDVYCYVVTKPDKRDVYNQPLETPVVYHLPKKSGNFGWIVNDKPILVCPDGKFPEKTGFLER